MKLIADTNVWYDIGSGQIDPQQHTSSGKELFATPTSLLEIASGIDNVSLGERRRAAEAVLNYATGVVEDTETHLANLWGIPTEQSSVKWIDGFKAIAAASSVEELEHGVADFQSRVLRKVGVSIIYAWREMHWRGFQSEIVDILDEWIPGYKKARTSGKYKRIAKKSREAFEEGMRSTELKRTLTLATYERVRLAKPDIMNPAEYLVAKVQPLLAPYIDAYSEYIIRCATEMAPQANDFGDCECFLYLQNGSSLVTSDDRWVRIAKAVCPGQISVPVRIKA